MTMAVGAKPPDGSVTWLAMPPPPVWAGPLGIVGTCAEAAGLVETAGAATVNVVLTGVPPHGADTG